MNPVHARRAGLVGLAFAALLASGCSVFPESSPVQRLDPRIDVEAGAFGPTRDVRLGLPRPASDPARDSNRILVRTAAGRLQVLGDLRWVAPAPDVVQTTLIRYLRDAEVFADVAPSAGLVDRALFIDLRRFELNESETGLQAVVEIDARVLDAASGQPLNRFHVLERVALASTDAAAVVAGFETVLAGLAERIARRLHERPAAP